MGKERLVCSYGEQLFGICRFQHSEERIEIHDEQQESKYYDKGVVPPRGSKNHTPAKVSRAMGAITTKRYLPIDEPT